jgi:hypothetical protein
MSLSVLVFLSSKQFAAMLLTARLVTVDKSNHDFYSHRVWETFIAEGDILTTLQSTKAQRQLH